MDHRSTEILGGELTAQMRARFYGKYRGVVTNVDDPDQIGRIMAKVPEVLGLPETTWATPCTTYPGLGEVSFTSKAADRNLTSGGSLPLGTETYSAALARVRRFRISSRTTHSSRADLFLLEKYSIEAWSAAMRSAFSAASFIDRTPVLGFHFLRSNLSRP